MVGFEKALGAVKVIKDQIQYRSQSLINLARGYFSREKITGSDSQLAASSNSHDSQISQAPKISVVLPS